MIDEYVVLLHGLWVYVCLVLTYRFLSFQLEGIFGTDKMDNASSFSCQSDSFCFPNRRIERFSAQIAKFIRNVRFKKC